MPSVSIILPTYNRAGLIGKALQSVLDQTYADFEVIVVDDASVDNTKEVVASFADKRIRYIRHEKNMGGSASRNTGIKASCGKYIAFQDSDDIWAKDKLEKQMQAFETASFETGVVYSGYLLIKDGSETYFPPENSGPYEGHIHTAIMKSNYIATPVAVVKKECFEKVGYFDENFPQSQDWDMWLRISKSYHFKYINEPLVVKHHQQDSINANTGTIIKGWKLLLKKHLSDYKKNRDLLSGHHIRIGTLLYENHFFFGARKHFLAAALARPSDRQLFKSSLFYFLFGIKLYQNFPAYIHKTKKFFKKTGKSCGKFIINNLRPKKILRFLLSLFGSRFLNTMIHIRNFLKSRFRKRYQ